MEHQKLSIRWRRITALAQVVPSPALEWLPSSEDRRNPGGGRTRTWSRSSFTLGSFLHISRACTVFLFFGGLDVKDAPMMIYRSSLFRVRDTRRRSKQKEGPGFW
jgi:hypothetical protein